MLKNILVILIPTGILSLSYFLWMRKKNEKKKPPVAEPQEKEQIVVEEEIVEEIKITDSFSNKHDLFEHISNEDKESVQSNEDCMSVSDDNKKSRRIRQQSNCDSAFVEDFLSDILSHSSSDSLINTGKSNDIYIPDVEASIINVENQEVFNENEFNFDGIDFFNTSEQKVLNWGSLPVSDIEDDDKLSIKDLNCYEESTKTIKDLVVEQKYKDFVREIENKPINKKNKKKSHKSPTKKNPKAKNDRTGKSQRTRRLQKSEEDTNWRESCSSNSSKNYVDEYIVCEYEISNDLCGKIIGRNGKYVKEIHTNTGATVCIEDGSVDSKKIVSISGLHSKVKKAEKSLMSRFKDSLIKLDDITFSDDNVITLEPTILPLDTYINVIVTGIENAGSIFLQIFNKEVDKTLIDLQVELANKYSRPSQKFYYANESKPSLNDICCGFLDNIWCRVQVQQYLDDENVLVSFVDYGGMVSVPWQILLRSSKEFLEIPAQAIKCYLSNVFPLPNETEYSEQANKTLKQLVEGRCLKAYVHYVCDDAIPCVELFYFYEESTMEVSVNQCLLQWGLAGGEGEVFTENECESSEQTS